MRSLSFLYSARTAVLVLVLILTSFYADAAPHLGTQMLFRQPDNSTVAVRVWGDEFYHRVESLDGYPLIRNTNNWICYAVLNEDGSEWLSTPLIYSGGDISAALERGRQQGLLLDLRKGVELSRAGILKKRMEVKQLPLLITREDRNLASRDVTARKQSVEKIDGLTIIIDFPDSQGLLSRDEISDFMNERGFSGFGNNGSVRDYFHDVSGGKVDYQNEVIGYYRARKPFLYYDTATALGHTEELLHEALDWADNRFDFSTLTMRDGKVRAINFLYAGSPSQGWTKGLWPHSGATHYEADGVEIRDYQITNFSDQLELAVVCHENGHMLFWWPDLYDYDFSSIGIGNYCLMAAMGSGPNPVPPNAYLRMMAGWENVISLNDTSAYFRAISNSSSSTFVYKNPSHEGEFFVIESRLKKGRNESLPDEGLMIWHVDEAGSNTADEMTPDKHFYVSIEQADGLFEVERKFGGDQTNDLFDNLNSNFGTYTVPDAKWWDGTISGLEIHQISAPSDTMTFYAGYSPLLPRPDQLEVTPHESKMVLRWRDNSFDEENFVIERKRERGEYVPISTVAKNVEEYVDADIALLQGWKYTYRVRAKAEALISYASEEVEARLVAVATGPFSGAPHPIPGIIQAEDYDLGGQGHAYGELTPGNHFGMYRDEGVDINLAMDEGDGFCVELQDNEWIAFTTLSSRADFFQINFRVKVFESVIFALHAGEKELATVAAAPSIDWQTVSVGEIRLLKGPAKLRLTVNSGSMFVNYFEVMDFSPPEAFPNPMEDKVFVRHNDISKAGKLQLVDMKGRLLASYAPGTSEFDVPPMAAGLYLIQLFDAKGIFYQSLRILKQE